MGIIRNSILSLFTLFLVTAAMVKPSESTRLYEKVVFIDVSSSVDSMLFKPSSKAWKELWKTSTNINCGGSDLMNYEKYEASFAGRTDNLWTILHPKIIKGEINAYAPYSPYSYGFGPNDNGELRYPVFNKAKGYTFLESDSVCERISYLLGYYGPMSDVPIVDQYGEDSITISPDGTASYIYPSRDYFWYQDKDIVKYRLRVRVLLSKSGAIKKRIIQSIAPIVNQFNDTGEVSEELEIIWLNFQELKPLLKKAYYFDSDWKPVTYWDFFSQKVREPDFKSREP